MTSGSVSVTIACGSWSKGMAYMIPAVAITEMATAIGIIIFEFNFIIFFVLSVLVITIPW